MKPSVVTYVSSVAAAGEPWTHIARSLVITPLSTVPIVAASNAVPNLTSASLPSRRPRWDRARDHAKIDLSKGKTGMRTLKKNHSTRGAPSHPIQHIKAQKSMMGQ